MRLDDLYFLEYSEYCPNLNRYIHNVSDDVPFGLLQSLEFDKKHQKAEEHIGQIIMMGAIE